MIICILAPEFVPVWGGAGTYTQELVEHLPKDYELHVVTPRREGFGSDRIEASSAGLNREFGDNVHVHYISSASDTFFYNAEFQYACLRRVPKILKDEGVDIIHSHMSHMPDLLLRMREHTTPTIVTLHNTIKVQRLAIKLSTQPFNSLERSEKAVCTLYPILSLTERMFLKGSNRYIAPSNWMKEEALRLSSISRKRADRISVIPNSVDVSRCKAIANSGKEQLSEVFANRRIILYSGRLMANKGIDLLVEAIPRILTATDSDLLFVFAGPGDSRKYVSRLGELGVPVQNFQFTGSITRTRCLELLGCAEVLVLPSFLENCPYAVLEAMACEVPVVASNVGGIPEIIENGQSGLTFASGSSAELSQKVIQLVQDRDLQRKLKQRALQVVSDGFSWSSNLEKQIRAYEATLN